MLRLILPCLLVAGCEGWHQPTTHPITIEQHERLARHYEATAASIERECWKARRNELTVADRETCWKAEDQRFLQANLDAAARHYDAAKRLRAGVMTANR